MTTRNRVRAAALGALLAALPAAAHEFKAGSIELDHPWSRATPAGAKVAAGYVTIENGGDASDTLVSATAEIAGRTEIHEMAVKDGVMTMRPLGQGVVVPARGEARLAPGGLHLMFMDLKRQLKQGESFSGALTFEKAGDVKVTFAVQSIGATGADHGASPGGHPDHATEKAK
ncbi:copper chaperone PCu(A)C [Methylopila sp. M107]|uniref:copper chaperone PCu(A)C n=1 Tax=Methylopila sp. M107 TaxID=1101190 RepID=UPI00035D0B79|nr:copper chaperone PCu(A)C [Methylopila sp. M107]